MHAASKQAPLAVLDLALVFSGPVWADLPAWLEWSTAGVAAASAIVMLLPLESVRPVAVTTATVTAVAALVILAEAFSGTSWLATGLAVGPPLLTQAWLFAKESQTQTSAHLL